ncbi:lantibiotic dehydratase [Spirosoma lituiforme]
MKISFFDKFVVRTPVKSFKFFHDILSSNEDINKTLVNILKDPKIINAIFLASPSIFQELEKHIDFSKSYEVFKEKTLFALIKYLARMSHRSTPFGLFTSISLGEINNESISLQKNSCTSVVLLDYTIEYQLYQRINEIGCLKKHLLFYPNYTIYSLNNNIFYINVEFDKEISYILSSFEKDDFLLGLLQKINGEISYYDLVNIITEEGFDVNEASLYVDDLINNNILLSELTFTNRNSKCSLQFLSELLAKNILNCSFIDSDLAILKSYQIVINNILSILDKIKLNIDNGYEFNLQNYSDNILTLISSINLSYDPNKVLQIDLIEKAGNNIISNQLLKDVSESIGILNKLSSPVINSSLDQFKKDFFLKFDDQLVPLLKVLDKNYGFEYGVRNNHNLSTSIVFSKKDFLLHSILLDLKDKNFTIDLANYDLTHFEENWNNVSASFSCLIQIYEAYDKNQIVIREVGGSSAVNILNRFGHLDASLLRHIENILSFESTVSTGLTANVTHLPNIKSGNIIRSSVSRSYEINVFSICSDKSVSIPLNDIFVTVKNDDIILFSRTLNSRIFPKIDNAYNVNFTNLSIFQFLNDVGNVGKKISMTFDWGNLKQFFSYFPRVKYKNCIVSLASWIIKKSDIPLNLLKNEDSGIDLFNFLVEKFQLPFVFNISEGDQLLFIDIRNKVLFAIFKKHLNNNSVSTITEILPFNDFSSIVKDDSGKTFAHEIVLGVKNEKAFTPNSFIKDLPFTSNTIKREFNIGEDWLYFKIYCSHSVSNLLILDIYNLFKEELFSDFADKFFFVRYIDTNSHIRIRFFKKQIDITAIVRKINLHLTSSHLYEYIKSFSIEKYSRELERYGEKYIEQVEDIFFYDSMTVCNLLHSKKSDSEKILFYLDYVDYIFNKLSFSLSNKINIVTLNKDSYLNEFSNQSHIKNDLAKFYRVNKTYITAFSEQENVFNYCDKVYMDSMISKYLFIKNDTDEVTFYRVITSCIHMSVNRAFNKDQRLSELYIYQMLFHRYRFLKNV